MNELRTPDCLVVLFFSKRLKKSLSAQFRSRDVIRYTRIASSDLLSALLLLLSLAHLELARSAVSGAGKCWPTVCRVLRWLFDERKELPAADYNTYKLAHPICSLGPRLAGLVSRADRIGRSDRKVKTKLQGRKLASEREAGLRKQVLTCGSV